MAKSTETDDKDDGEKESIIGVGELREFIAETVKTAVAGLSVGTGEKTDNKSEDTDKGIAGSDIAAQVKRELDRVRAHEARQKRDEEIDTTLKALKERTAETQPVERRKVHRFMGWGE